MNIYLRMVCFSVFAFTSVLLLLYGIMSMSSSADEVNAKTTIRTLSVALPPPPPPPPVQKQTQLVDAAPSLNLSHSGTGVVMQIQTPQLEVTLAEPALPEVQLQSEQSSLLDHLNFDWSAFGLSDLDETPRLLTSLKITFPDQLKRKGVRIAEVELDVMIDEHGSVLLRRVIHNEHPELERAIKLLVQKARFSVPKKDGVAVRAAFNWPVEFADS